MGLECREQEASVAGEIATTGRETCWPLEAGCALLYPWKATKVFKEGQRCDLISTLGMSVLHWLENGLEEAGSGGGEAG